MCKIRDFTLLLFQWLVKRSMEYRQEMSAFVRSYAVNQFNKQFDVKDKDLDIRKHILENLNTVSEIYRPQRYYKRKNAPPPDFPSRVQITLLEYDHRGGNIQAAGSVVNVNEEGVLEKQQAQEVL